MDPGGIMTVRVKICGLTRPEDVAACARAGVAYAGFNFFPKSPRYLTPSAARDLALQAPVGLAKVGLVVGAGDDLLDGILAEVPLDMIQLHGGESPQRVQALRRRYGLPVIKVIGLSDAADLPQIAIFEEVADMILIDAKPPRDAVLPGGNGLVFDWRLIAGRSWARPWMLAGGLTAANAAAAVQATGATQLDTASGVESAPGVKDATMIADFVAAAQGVEQVPMLR